MRRLEELPPGIISAGAVVWAARKPTRQKPAFADAQNTGRGGQFITHADGTVLLKFDVSGIADRDPERLPALSPEVAVRGSRWPVPDQATFEPGSFGHRVSAKRVDLVELMVKGVPPVDYLPASEGMLVRGKRHLIPAPKKTGKSIAMLVHWCDMIAAGVGGVVVLDRENGQEEYARRLAAIMEYKGWGQDEIEFFRDRFHYFEFPRFKKDEGEKFAALVESFGAEVVVLDSQRMFLTDLGLAEDSTDDYAVFMENVIDPLFREGITTVILDNTGHTNQGRSRGASGKGDLNEVLFVMEAVSPFDLNKAGQVRLKIEESRFGNRGTWLMDIGGGQFGSWHEPGGVAANPELLRVAQETIASQPGIGANKILDAARDAGIKVGNQKNAKTLLNRYADDPTTNIQRRANGGGYEVA